MISGLFKRSIKSVIVVGCLMSASGVYAQLGINWKEMGPNNLGGRCRSVLVDKTDNSGNTLYAAGVSGGVFKTTNAGSTWSALNDQSDAMIVTSMNQANDGTIYIGTGESFGRGTSGFAGSGLYKFTPGSNAITLVKDSSTFGNINEIATGMSTAPNTIYIAADKGFFISTDAGNTFTEDATTTGTPNLSAMDVKVAKDGGVYFSYGSKNYILPPTGPIDSKVYYSSNGSSGSFANISPTLPATYNAGRIEIGVSPSDENYVYLSIAKQFTLSNNAGGGLSGVFVSDNKGTTWNVVSYGTANFDPFTSGTRGFGDYSNVIVVHPTDPKTFYLGGLLFKTWTQIAGQPLGKGDWDNVYNLRTHTHEIKYNSAKNAWFVANDGGVYKSVNNTNNYIIGGLGLLTPPQTMFLSFNLGFNIAQMNSVAYQTEPTSSSTVAASFVGLGGGSKGNDFIYLPGDLNTPQGSTSFGPTDAFQADFSKINPTALFYTQSFGTLLRTSNIKTAPFTEYTDNTYAIGATGGPGSVTFANENTPGRLWENFGGGTNDYSLFYNPPVKSSFVNSNVTQTKFTISNKRPIKSARYQRITITAVSTKSVAAPPSQTIIITPKYEGVREISSYVITGSANTSSVNNNIIVQNDSSLLDNISFTFSSPPKDSAVITAKMDIYYVPGPDTLYNTVSTGTVSTQNKYYVTLKRPNRNGLYQSVTVVDPSNSQTITILPAYSGSVITSYTVAGPTNTTNIANCVIKLNASNLYSALDTIKFAFDAAPAASTTIAATTIFDPRDSITVSYEDISGASYVAGIPVTTAFTNTETPRPVRYIPLKASARYAVGIGGTSVSGLPAAIYVSKKPLNFSIIPDFVKIAGKNSRPDSTGGIPHYPKSTITNSITGTVTRLEWSPNGECIYFATMLDDSTNYLYRISHLQFIGDSTATDYSGLFTFDVDSASTFRRNPTPRTTTLGKFKYPITSISVKSDNSNVMITTGGYKNKTATIYESNGNATTLNQNATDASNFTVKNGTGGTSLPLIPAYSSLYEVGDNKRVLIGTEQGIYSTLDFSQPNPVWMKENNSQLPNVPIYQIRQQTLPHWLSKNSGTIYVATHGRGMWSTDKYYTPFAIGIEEQEEKPTFGNNMLLYPNPASNNVNLSFNAAGDASYKINVYDINGRVLIQESTGKLMEGEQVLPLNTSSLVSGIYFISIYGSNNFTATSKLIINK